MRTLEEITTEIKALEEQTKEIQKKLSTLNKERFEVRGVDLADRVKKRFRVGHFYMRVPGLTNFHCDPATVYEIISNLNGNCFDVRKIKLHYSDGDYYGLISKEHISFASLDGCDDIKEISSNEYKEFVDIVYNPEKAEAWVEEHKQDK